MIENEIYIMRSCNHPNIVKLYEEFETQDEVYLITDLVKVFIHTMYINSLVFNLFLNTFSRAEIYSML
jgi:serine/threonine protein kinase